MDIITQMMVSGDRKGLRSLSRQPKLEDLIMINIIMVSFGTGIFFSLKVGSHQQWRQHGSSGA